MKCTIYTPAYILNHKTLGRTINFNLKKKHDYHWKPNCFETGYAQVVIYFSQVFGIKIQLIQLIQAFLKPSQHESFLKLKSFFNISLHVQEGVQAGRCSSTWCYGARGGRTWNLFRICRASFQVSFLSERIRK